MLASPTTTPKFGTYILQEPISGLQQNLDGEQVPFTPDWTGTARRGIPDPAEPAAHSMTPGTNIQYSSSFSTNDFDYVSADRAATRRSTSA
jgi:hypothetical protein